MTSTALGYHAHPVTDRYQLHIHAGPSWLRKQVLLCCKAGAVQCAMALLPPLQHIILVLPGDVSSHWQLDRMALCQDQGLDPNTMPFQ